MKAVVRNSMLAGILVGCFSLNAHASLIVGILEDPGSSANQLALLDTNTGDTTPLATILNPVNNQPFGLNKPNGLAHDEAGNRFVFAAGSSIYSISYVGDPETGTYGPTSLLWTSQGNDINSGAWYNGSYYFVQSNILRSISGTTPDGAVLTAADTNVVNMGNPVNLGNDFGDIEIGSDGYMYVSNASRFRRLNLNNLGNGPLTELSTDPTTDPRPQVQLAFGLDGLLYGIDPNPVAAGGEYPIYRINTDTGAFTDIGTTPVKLTDAARVPEPAVLGLLGLGLTAMGFVGRRRRQAAIR